MKLKFGSHISFRNENNYLLGAVKEALSYNATALMIYLGAPQNSRRTAKEKLFLNEYEEQYQDLLPKENILVHAPYIVNPSSVEKHQFAIDFLINEIETMNYLGLKQLVLHPGAYTKFSREESLQVLIKSLKVILSKTNDVEIHLEIMAGKGTEVGTTFKELKYVIDNVASNRLGICLDTCHAWDAGYNVNDFDATIKELKNTQTLNLIKSLHINDSKNPLFAKKDRHANIGAGFINPETLKKFVHAKEFENLIKVLETPWIDGKPPYKDEIARLKNKN